MTIMSPAIEWVRVVAERLGDLRDEVVFLGGATVSFLITDQATTTVRATKDVDVIVEVSSWGEYVPLQERLRARGFSEDASEGAPICRWVVAGIKVDVMPTSGKIFGFSNRWYGPAMKTAQPTQLSDAITINVVSAPYFVATKIEAFHGRGNKDYFASHDVEDLIAVVDGRSELNAEIEKADTSLREYLRDQLSALLADHDFRYSLQGHLQGDAASQARLPTLLWRLHRMHSEDEEQALLRTLLDHIIDQHELPGVRHFRLAHEEGRALLSNLGNQGLVRMERGRYSLTTEGLRRTLPGRATSEVARCNTIIDELKAMYRSDPERLWPTWELAESLGADVAETARAVTFLSPTPLFSGLNWNAGTGFVQSFSLSALALDAAPLKTR